MDKSTLVRTPNGFKRIEMMGPPLFQGMQIPISSHVLSADEYLNATVARCSHLYRDPSPLGFRLELAGGYELKGSENHPVYCELDGKSAYRSMGELAQLSTEALQKVQFRLAAAFDWQCEPVVYRFRTVNKMTLLSNSIRSRLRRFRDLTISQAAKTSGITYSTVRDNLSKEPEAESELLVDEEIGYFLGVMIGDGCLCAEKAHALLSTLDQCLIEKVLTTVQTRFTGSLTKRAAKCDWEIKAPTVRDLFRSLGLAVKSQFKFVPDIILESPKPVIRAFLQGLFDTDGTSDKKGYVAYCSSSERLANQVQQLLLAFGIFSKRYFKPNQCAGAWMIQINGHARRFYDRVGFTIKRKQDRSAFLPVNKFRSQRFTDLGHSFVVPARSLTACEVDLYDLTVPRFSNFIGNGLINHNTWGAVHRICRHLWETPGARVGFFAKSVKLAKDGGVWQDLLDLAIPEWINSGIGFQFTTFDSTNTPGPKQDAQTRTAYFRVRNMYGGESECKLFSIDHDHEVGSKVHGKRFSMIFFSELWMFKEKVVLAATLPALRMPHLMPKEGEPDIWHQWMADTNPDPELGNRSWFYDVWYKERLDANHKYPKIQANLHLIEMFIEENPFATEYDREELAAFCAGDDCLYDSYVRGVHGEGAAKRDRFFASSFDRTVHVIGSGPDPEENQIHVHQSSDLLLSGWDLGNRNHAAVILEPWFRSFTTQRGSVVRACFSVLDELLVLNETISLDDFTVQFMAKMKEIEDRWDRKFKWDHWSDDSATTVWRPSSGSYDCMEVEAASQGKIVLQGVMKPHGSIEARVRIVKMLLRQRRLWISSRCEHVISMIENLRRGDTDKEYVLNDKFKHIFDALTYPIYVRVCDELLENADPRSGKRDENLDYIGVG